NRMSGRVLVIIPAYNEAESIGAVLDRLREACPNYDVLVVDDGSVDETAKVVEKHPGVELVRMPYNVGIGATMQTGYLYAARNGYDIAVQCDADGQHPVEEIPRLIERIEDSAVDLVIGSRYVSNTDYKPPFARRVGKSMLSRVVDMIVGGGITDTTSGFRAANRNAVRLFANHYPDDYPEAEALVILHKAGLKAIEIPVNMNARQGGITSIGPLDAAYYMVKVALAIFIDVFRRFTRSDEDRTP
ncbi:MAG: glycosyltransferase family 2 protein, partial [Candidatus Hydrogenedentes bacterium]|nr:glycosyltransferase family 2 protein [Candidatus Hydrogenedentota bacterium]